ncbi:MAG: hypothetical protein ACMV0I_02580 [Pseudomonas sp.]
MKASLLITAKNQGFAELAAKRAGLKNGEWKYLHSSYQLREATEATKVLVTECASQRDNYGELMNRAQLLNVQVHKRICGATSKK